MPTKKEPTVNVEVNDIENSVIKQQADIIEQLQKQMEEMRKALVSLQSENVKDSVSVDVDEPAEIGTRFIRGINISSPNGDSKVFIPCGETVFVSPDEMKLLIRSNTVRDFLKKDVIYFVDENNYQKYKIYDRYDLSDKSVSKLIETNNIEQIIAFFNKVTKNQKDHPVFHSLFYQIVDLVTNNKVKMEFNVRKAIEEYFNFPIDRAQAAVDQMRQVVV